MNIKKAKELKKHLEVLRNAMFEINELWDNDANEVLEDEYPFNSSFDELTLEVATWVDTAHDTLDGKVSYYDIAFADMIDSKRVVEVNGDNIELFNSLGIEYEDLHFGVYDATNVILYNEWFRIIEQYKSDSKEVLYHVVVGNEDDMCKTLREAEKILFDRLVCEEVYNNEDIKKDVMENHAIKKFIAKT